MSGLLAMLDAYERGRLLAMMERDIAGAIGLRTERLGDPALEGSKHRINCVNCGAPRVAASSGCDYCGSV